MGEKKGEQTSMLGSRDSFFLFFLFCLRGRWKSNDVDNLRIVDGRLNSYSATHERVHLGAPALQTTTGHFFYQLTRVDG